eukprot:XP_001709519.1 Hypothetical protein GL50803_96364 [Giardia lamblia ATCC 50803]
MRSKLLMIILVPAPLLRGWRILTLQAQRWHRTVIYLLRPLYLIRYISLLILGLIFIFRYLLVIKNMLPIFQFITFLLTVWTGECMKARYSGIYELRPLLIDEPWNNLNQTFTDKYVFYEADVWIKLFTSNVLAIIMSFTELGKRGLRLLPFVFSLIADVLLQILRPYGKFRAMGYNKGLLHCIIDSCQYMNRALRNRL